MILLALALTPFALSCFTAASDTDGAAIQPLTAKISAVGKRLDMRERKSYMASDVE
jgi:hypothetical protein